MLKNWLTIVGCLALATGQASVYAQDDETVPAVAPEPTADAAATPADAATGSESPTPASEAATPAAETPAAAPVAEAPAAAPTPLPETLPTAKPSVARSLQPMADVNQSSAIGFRKVSSTGGFANPERTSVRIVQSGRIVQTHRVGIGGVVQVSEVSPGAYSIFASGNEGFAAFGTYLGDTAYGASNRVGLVPQRDAQIVRRLIEANLRTGTGTPTTKKVSRNSSTENSDFELQADGSVKGQIIRATPTNQDAYPITDMFVAFVRDNQVVAEARSDAQGEFSLTGLSPGIYSLAAAGPEGFVCFSSAVIQPEPRVQARVRRLEFVALLGSSSSATIVPVPASDFRLLQQYQTPGTNSTTSAPGVGGNGLGGGGGAGGGGAGGFGGAGLIGALAGAGIGAALAGNNGNGNGPVTPAAP